MTQCSSYLELACGAIPIFANDGTLDEKELEWLLTTAMADNRLDDDERRVLRSIFSRVARHQVSPRVWNRIQEARTIFEL